MGSTAGPTGLDELDTPQAWARIRECRYGRLAVIVHDTPEIFPVTHVVDHGTVVFRTAVGTKLSACVGRPVAFEVDGVDYQKRLAWSVVVKGRAREIRGTEEMIEALSLPLSPLHPSGKPRFVRIDPSAVTGRQFVIAG